MSKKPIKKGSDDSDGDARRFVTPEFRVSYPHVFKPQAMKGAKPKFSITMLFKKSADLSLLKLAIKHAKIEEFGPNKDNWPDDIESPVQDGDEGKNASREGYDGHWVVKASSHEAAKPGVVDKDLQAIVDPTEFYPGCFARAQVFARVWEFPEGSGRYGIHFILDHVMKTRDGDNLSGRKSAEEVFQPFADESSDSDDSDDEDDF